MAYVAFFIAHRGKGDKKVKKPRVDTRDHNFSRLVASDVSRGQWNVMMPPTQLIAETPNRLLITLEDKA